MPKLRAVSWASVSSLPQVAENKVSIEEQLRLNKEWCEQHEADIIDTLVIPGHSRYESDLLELLDDYARQGIWAYHKIREHWKARDFDVLVCYHDSRFGRSSTAYNFVAENVIRSGRRIYRVTSGGWLDSSNAQFGLALGSMAATAGITQLVEGRKMGMKRRAMAGLPTSSGVPMTHILIRDERGKAQKLIVDESKRGMFDDFYTLFVKRRISYRSIERLLFEEFGHASSTGRAYQPMRFYAILTNPVTHGHSARHHRTIGKGGFAAKGDWIFKEGSPIPEGVVVYYNTHPAVWEGQAFEDIFAEFQRRQTLNKRSGGDQAHPFTGLLLCAGCGYNLVYIGSGTGRPRGMRCTSHYHISATRPDCDQNAWLNEKKIRAWLTPRLEQLIVTRDWSSFLDVPRDERQLNLELQSVMDEITRVNRRILRMIDDQSRQSSASVTDLYEKKILAAGDRLDVLNKRLGELTMQSSTAQHATQQREFVLNEMADIGIDAFWQLPAGEINQMLHRLMANRRLLVLDGQIIGTREARTYNRQ